LGIIPFLPYYPQGNAMDIFLFSDIEGSTQKWEQYRNAMGAALERHDSIVRDSISRYGGKVVKHTGDGIFAVFKNGEALKCAIEINARIEKENWSAVGGLKVRIAVNGGSAEKRGEDYFGPAVNCTQRIMSMARGGQILFTPAAMQICKFPQKAIVKNLGTHLLKGLSAAQQIFELENVAPLPQAAAVAPPPGAADAADTNAEDVNAIHQLLTYYLENRMYRQGIQAFLRLASKNARSSQVMLCLGVLYERGGYDNEAIQAFKTVIHLNSREALAYRFLSRRYLLRQEYDEAIKVAQQGIAVDSRAERLHFNLGYAYALKGMHEMAIDEFQQEISVDPLCSEAYYNIDAVKRREIDAIQMKH